MFLEINDFKEHVDQQFAKARAGKLFLTVLAKRKEASVYLAVIFNQIIIKCQVNFQRKSKLNIRGVQIYHRLKSCDRFTTELTTDFVPVTDKNPVVNLWLSILESVIHTTDFFPVTDKKSVVNLW